ncbi:hypothetical protein GW846_03330 [Candidatus Gracilibacteria bacterium]|nr:hypothetical protein [Candidatus Gracilibacteria bacterium]
MKTKFRELLDKERGLSYLICKTEKMATKTIDKAANGGDVTFTTKFRIYSFLLEHKVIDINTKTLDLFEPMKEGQPVEK